MATDPAGLPPDVDPLAWAVVTGLALGGGTVLFLLVSGHFTPGAVALVVLVPAVVGCAGWLGRVLRRR